MVPEHPGQSIRLTPRRTREIADITRSVREVLGDIERHDDVDAPRRAQVGQGSQIHHGRPAYLDG